MSHFGDTTGLLYIELSSLVDVTGRYDQKEPEPDSRTNIRRSPALFTGINELNTLSLVLESDILPAAVLTLLFVGSWC